MKPAPQVTCRPDDVMYGAAAFCFLLCGLPVALWVTTHPRTLAFGVFCFGLVGLLVLVALWAIAFVRRGRIEADASGLCWRKLLRWHHASWAEVSDYYEQLDGKSKRVFVVETYDGTLRVHEANWTDTAAFCEFVQQNATRAKERSWQLQGTRSSDPWPRVFSYRRSSEAWFFLIGTVVTFCIGIAGVTEPYWNPSHYEFVFTGALMLFFWLLYLHLALDFLRRRNQRITVTVQEITFEDAGRTLRVPWSEVSDYRLVPCKMYGLVEGRSKNVVSTRRGEFDFSHLLQNYRMLMRIIARFAQSAACREWKSADTDSLGGEKARWKSGRSEFGERIFHYRTRTNRALLAFGTVMVLLTLVGPLWRSFLFQRAPQYHSILALVTAFAIPTLWGWSRYFGVSIRTNELGITRHGLRSTRHISWSDIRRYYLSGEDALRFAVVAGGQTRICFWIGIADAQELANEITRRAVNSQTKKWEKP